VTRSDPPCPSYHPGPRLLDFFSCHLNFTEATGSRRELPSQNYTRALSLQPSLAAVPEVFELINCVRNLSNAVRKAGEKLHLQAKFRSSGMQAGIAHITGHFDANLGASRRCGNSGTSFSKPKSQSSPVSKSTRQQISEMWISS
jgi:hypothetical protein